MQLDSPVIIGNPSESAIAMGNVSGSTTFNLTLASYITCTVTGAVTVTMSSDANLRGSLIQITNGGSATVTWPTSVKWPGGTVPGLTAAGVDFISIFSADGVTFYASMAMKDAK